MDDTDSAAALAIMRTWNWERWDLEFCKAVPVTRSLSEAVNELAFHWQGDAPSAVLSLLASGKLVATGSFKWRAYRKHEHLQHEGAGTIPAHRWQCLSDTIAERLRAGWDEGYSPIIHLQKLELGETDKDDWAWRSNRFSIAEGDEDEWIPGYSEEWFSAWFIEVLPAPASNASLEALPSPETPAIERKRGRKPIYDWEGAMAHIVAVANTPDGLETGHGAQAAIEGMIADYFARTRDDGKDASKSERQKRANLILDAIAALKTEKAMAA